MQALSISFVQDPPPAHENKSCIPVSINICPKRPPYARLAEEIACVIFSIAGSSPPLCAKTANRPEGSKVQSQPSKAGNN